MIKTDFKKIFNIDNIIIFFASIFFLYSFINFETSLILKIIILLIFVTAVIIAREFNKISIVVIALYFLAIYNFYNFYFTFNWSLGLVLMLVLIVSYVCFLLFFGLNKNVFYNINIISYVTLIGLIETEIFLGLLVWPVDPKNKALLVTSVFYLAYGLFELNAQKKLTFKRSLPYIIIVITIIILVVSTSEWYGY